MKRMTDAAKNYMLAVNNILRQKYDMTEIKACLAIQESFLYDSLLNYPEETIHDDAEMNADAVWEGFNK